MAVGKAARLELAPLRKERSGLWRPGQRCPRTKDPAPGGFPGKKLPGFVAPQSKPHL